MAGNIETQTLRIFLEQATLNNLLFKMISQLSQSLDESQGGKEMSIIVQEVLASNERQMKLLSEAVQMATEKYDAE